MTADGSTKQFLEYLIVVESHGRDAGGDPSGKFDAALPTVIGRPFGHPVQVFINSVMST
jgi:hypothetical protein